MRSEGSEDRLDRVERLCEFLTQQQAQLNASCAERNEERKRELDEMRVRMEEQAARTDEQIRETNQQVRQTGQEIQELGAFVLNLAKIVQQTDERLNAVILKVERYLEKGGRN